MLLLHIYTSPYETTLQKSGTTKRLQKHCFMEPQSCHVSRQPSCLIKHPVVSFIFVCTGVQTSSCQVTLQKIMSFKQCIFEVCSGSCIAWASLVWLMKKRIQKGLFYQVTSPVRPRVVTGYLLILSQQLKNHITSF